MMADRFEVSGLDEIFSSLKKLEPKIRLKFAKNATKAGAMLMKNKAKANAPKLTGALKRGFGVKAMKAHPDRVGSMVIIRTGGARTKSQKKKNDDPFYWYFQERGYYNTKGKFFVEEAFNSKKNSVVNEATKRIASDIDKYNGR